MEKNSTPTAESPEVDVAILDGAVVVQMASPGTARTFQEYADNVFMPYIMKQLQPVKRVDIIWDVYGQDSLKAATREKRGSGTRRRVILFPDSEELEEFLTAWMRTRQSSSRQVESCHVEGKEHYLRRTRFKLAK